MADPLTALFGRRAFRGTGRTSDYFPEAPDLAFLERPMLPSGGGYNSKLDPENLIAAGFSPRNAMMLQGVRQQFHERAAAEREYADSQRALEGLSRLDPAKKNFSTELLNIFRSSPGAMRNPEVLQQADFISRFAKPPEWTIENIEDPDIYQQAVAEKWDTLTPQEARRRAAGLVTQRAIRGELAALGMSKADLDKIPSWSQEDYLREKGRLLRESKAAPREALGSSELGKFNEALTAYNEAAAGVDAAATEDAKREAFKLARGKDPQTAQEWQEAYNLVKQSTVGAPRQALQQLVELYQGRNIPDVVLRTLGVQVAPDGSQSPTAPSWPAEAPTSFGTPQTAPAAPVQPAAAPAVSSPRTTAPVSQADLKRIEPAAPASFESLSQQVTQKAEQKRKLRENEQRRKAEEEQARIDINVPRWEGAKQELLQQFDPAYLKFAGDPEIKTMLAQMGKTWNAKAFDDATGEPVSWLEVGRALLSDDRVKAIREGKGTLPGTPPISTPQQQELPRVENAEQFAAIQSGQWFIDSSGMPKRKK